MEDCKINANEIKRLEERVANYNIAGFKQYLSENNVNVYYPLTDSTITKIQNIKEELNNFGDFSNIEIETTYN